MAVNYKEKSYSSKKHPMLEHIFFSKYSKNAQGDYPTAIDFTLKDISDGYKACKIDEPASISNTILDLTRKRGDISSRLPPSIYELGFDLQKKTGTTGTQSYAGSFVFVGKGKQIQSWLDWPESMKTITISSSPIPSKVLKLLRKDEGALFSVIDYCDVLSIILFDKKQKIYRVQNPMKWQPNEIDGFYFGEIEGQDFLFPVEAKALTTGDDINLVQLKGGVETILTKMLMKDATIMPLAAQMVTNGIRVATFRQCHTGAQSYDVVLENSYLVTFDPPIASWQ